MRPIVQAWLDDYDVWHRNSHNRRIHAVTVPLILFHVVAMLDWVDVGALGGVRVSLAYLVVALFGAAWTAASPRHGAVLCALGLAFLALGRIAPAPVVFAAAVLGWTVETAGHVVWEERHPPFVATVVQGFTGPLAFADRVLHLLPR
jgi:uncharacterized membrane protein YGL010W